MKYAEGNFIMNKRAKWIWTIASVLIMVLIFYFSSQDGTKSDTQSLFFVKMLLSYLPENLGNFIIRKGAHFTIYAALGFCLYQSCFQWTKSMGLGSSLISLLIAFLYACSDEWHQTFIAGRSGALKDVLLDSLGAGCGIVISVLLLFWIIKNRRKKSL